MQTQPFHNFSAMEYCFFPPIFSPLFLSPPTLLWAKECEKNVCWSVTISLTLSQQLLLLVQCFGMLLPNQLEEPGVGPSKSFLPSPATVYPTSCASMIQGLCKFWVTCLRCSKRKRLYAPQCTMKLEGRGQYVLLDCRALQLSNLGAISKPRFKKTKIKKMEKQNPFTHRGFGYDQAKNLHVWNLKTHKVPLPSMKIHRHVYAP